MNKHWFYTTVYAVFSDCTKTTKRSPPDNLTPWTITQSKRFYEKIYLKHK